MSLTYGFYNSVNNDRVYDAEQVSSIFDGLVNDGIYMSIGGKMTVKTNTGFTVKIGSGRAWFKHTWTYNDSDYNITLDPADPLLNRIDAVILQIDRSPNARANSFRIVKGETATNPERPTLTNNAYIGQYPLAYIYIAAGKTEISQADITNMIGSNETPYVKGIIENISISDMTAQWQAQFSQWMSAIDAENTQWTTEQHAEFLEWATEQEENFDSWISEKQNEFNTWFNNMKGQLSEDAAGNLQLEIDQINGDIENLAESIATVDRELDSKIDGVQTTFNQQIDTINGNISNIQTSLGTKLNKSAKASEQQAKDGTSNGDIYMNPLRVAQAIAELAPRVHITSGKIFNGNIIPQTSGYSNYYYFVSMSETNIPQLSVTGNRTASAKFYCDVEQATRKVSCYTVVGSSRTFNYANYIELAWN